MAFFIFCILLIFIVFINLNINIDIFGNGVNRKQCIFLYKFLLCVNMYFKFVYKSAIYQNKIVPYVYGIICAICLWHWLCHMALYVLWHLPYLIWHSYMALWHVCGTIWHFLWHYGTYSVFLALLIYKKSAICVPYGTFNRWLHWRYAEI